ncbi:MAG: hypothetical protein IJO47_03775 [Clostridia bacterium]|nr:hypothetical protein [Clostridia bacterium]
MFSIDVPRIAVAYVDTAKYLKAEYMDRAPVIIADNYADYYSDSAYSYVIDLDMISKNAAFEIFARAAYSRELVIFVTENPALIELFGIVEYRGGDVYADACKAKPVEFESYDAVTLNLPIPVNFALKGRIPNNDISLFIRYGAHFKHFEEATHLLLTEDIDVDFNGKKVLAIGDGYNVIARKLSDKERIYETAEIKYEHNGWKFGYFIPDRESEIWDYGQFFYFVTKDEYPKMILTDDIIAMNFYTCFEEAKHIPQNFVRL